MTDEEPARVLREKAAEIAQLVDEKFPGLDVFLIVADGAEATAVMNISGKAALELVQQWRSRWEGTFGQEPS